MDQVILAINIPSLDWSWLLQCSVLSPHTGCHDEAATEDGHQCYTHSWDTETFLRPMLAGEGAGGGQGSVQLGPGGGSKVS